MSKTYVPQALRQKVADQARNRCGYCLTAQRLSGMLLTIEHLLPEARGGKTEEDNFWLACVDCNDYKGDRIEAVDPVTGEVVKLFDPRQQRWGEHFAWNAQGDEIVGRTAIGRATVVALRLNRPFLVQARQIWVKAEEHPPKD